MLSFIAQNRLTAETHEIAASDFFDAKKWLDDYVGDPADYVIHVSGIDAREAREVKRFRRQIQKRYEQDIKDCKDMLYV